MNLEHPAVCPDPVRPPVMAQRWADLAYLHWTVDETEVRTYVRDESGRPACGSIPSTGAPHVMWSPGVDVAIGTLSSAVLV